MSHIGKYHDVALHGGAVSPVCLGLRLWHGLGDRRDILEDAQKAQWFGLRNLFDTSIYLPIYFPNSVRFISYSQLP